MAHNNFVVQNKIYKFQEYSRNPVGLRRIHQFLMVHTPAEGSSCSIGPFQGLGWV